MKATRDCSVDGCDRPFHARTWCRTHYRRWRETGDPGDSFVWPRRPGRICAVEDCDKPVRCADWCKKHYVRWLEHGDPYRERPRWRSDVVTYAGAHARLRKLRGSAKLQDCADCGGPAQDWAYDNADLDALVGDNHGRECVYSLDPDHYLPLCKPCHATFDVAVAKSQGRPRRHWK